MDRTAEIETLLSRAKTAHGEYERAELGGVYDEQWPRWYADFIVANGLSPLIGRPIDADELATFLQASWAEQQRTAPSEPWERFTATRVATLLAS